MNPWLAIVRVCLYAAVAACAARTPDIAGTAALLPPTHPIATTPAFDGSATLGWLTVSIAAALANTLGFAGLAFGTVVATVGTLALVEWRAARVSSPPVALAAAALAAACSLDVLHVGADASTGLFFAMLLVAFDLAGNAKLIAIALVTALWCNASPTGIVAPLFAFAYVLGAAVDRDPLRERVHAMTATIVSALALFATPAFASFPALAWRAISLDNTLNDLLPSAPYVVAPLEYRIGPILTIVVALAAGARVARTGSTYAFVLAAFFAFTKGGFVPFLAIAGGPILAQSAAGLFAFAKGRGAPTRRTAAILVGTALPIALVVATISLKTLPAIAEASMAAPFGALVKFSQLPEPRGRLLCTKLAWCDVAERRYGITVLADTRIASASDAVIASQRAISGAKKGWNAKARAAGVRAIFLDRHSGFATLLAADGWTPYASDGLGALYVRSGTPLGQTITPQ